MGVDPSFGSPVGDSVSAHMIGHAVLRRERWTREPHPIRTTTSVHSWSLSVLALLFSGAGGCDRWPTAIETSSVFGAPNGYAPDAGGADAETLTTTRTGAQACATYGSCLNGGGLSPCLSIIAQLNDPEFAQSSQITPQEVNCLATVGSDCAAAHRCLNDGNDPQACSGNSSTCDGDVLSICDATNATGNTNGTRAIDCTDLGETCVNANGNFGCGLGSCSGGSQCNGTKLETCDTGILHETECANYGATCAVTLTIAHCRGAGPACQGNVLNPLAGLRCDGNKLVYCFDGQEASRDCAAENTKCVTDQDGSNPRCALGNECDPNNAGDVTCNGTVLTFCNNGVKDTYDCGKAGWKGCNPDNGGSCTN